MNEYIEFKKPIRESYIDNGRHKKVIKRKYIKMHKARGRDV